MTELKVKLIGDSNYLQVDLLQSVNHILESNNLLAMSSLTGSQSYINTAYFSYNSKLELFILTEHTTIHAQNIEKNPSVAVAIWIDSATYGENLQGLQLFGSCEKVSTLKMIEALNNYNNRFPTFAQIIKHPADFAKGVVKSRLYVLKINKLKLIDEPTFGRRNYISLTIGKS
jgi:uncharacterized protein YhbP (UPF0306 family)